MITLCEAFIILCVGYSGAIFYKNPKPTCFYHLLWCASFLQRSAIKQTKVQRIILSYLSSIYDGFKVSAMLKFTVKNKLKSVVICYLFIDAKKSHLLSRIRICHTQYMCLGPRLYSNCFGHQLRDRHGVAENLRRRH